MADEAEYQKGDAPAPGEGEQLPQGEATGLNAQEVTPAPELDPAIAAATQGEPDAMAMAQAAFNAQVQQQIPNIGFQQMQSQYTPGKGSVEEFLFAPSPDNMANVTTGASTFQRMPVPREVFRLLPTLDAAAADPSAPPQLRVLRDLIVFHLGKPV